MRQLLAGLGGSSGAFAAAGICVALVAAGYWVQTTRNAENAAAPVLAAVPQADGASQEVNATPEVIGDPEKETVVQDAPAEGEVADLKPTPAPTFDEVRREADGVTVIAGKGVPGAEITVLQNGIAVAKATADTAGEFATIALIPPDGQGHILSLLQTALGQEITSADEIILAPLAAPVEVAEAPAEDAPEARAAVEEVAQEEEVALVDPAPAVPATDHESAVEAPEAPSETQTVEAVTETQEIPAAAQPVVVAEVSQPQAPAVPAEGVVEETQSQGGSAAPTDEPIALAGLPDTLAEQDTLPIESAPAPAPARPTPAEQAPQTEAEAQTPAEPETETVAVLKSTEEGVELLNTQAPEVLDNVAIDTISYSDVGDVQLAGRAQTAATAVRVYLNNNAILDLPVDETGRWRGDLPDVDEGIYTLRVDEVAASGQVTSRVETPFKREAPAVLAAASVGQDGPIKAITVQKGATLWAIARERYGEGELYVRVFEANRDAIRNPDLIYPGQIFDLPD